MVLTLCMLTNITTFTSVFFGKIVIDSSSKEISIYYLRRDTYRFDDIKELKAIYQSGDGDGGMDTHKVLFIFTNGRKIELRTASQVQTEELIALLNSIVFNKNYLE